VGFGLLAGGVGVSGRRRRFGGIVGGSKVAGSLCWGRYFFRVV